jgi:hypothetical protein
MILLSLRDFQDGKADVIVKYTADEARSRTSNPNGFFLPLISRSRVVLFFFQSKPMESFPKTPRSTRRIISAKWQIQAVSSSRTMRTSTLTTSDLFTTLHDIHILGVFHQIYFFFAPVVFTASMFCIFIPIGLPLSCMYVNAKKKIGFINLSFEKLSLRDTTKFIKTQLSQCHRQGPR